MPHESFDNKDLLDAKESKNGISSFVEGLYEGATNVRNKPGETALSVAGGLAIGAGLQAVFNKAEGYSTFTGAAAGFAKKALAPVAIALAGVHVRNAEDQFKEVGKQVFDVSMFLGAAKLGAVASETVPGLRNLLGPKAKLAELEPKPTTELPQFLQFKIENGQVRILNSAERASSFEQVRLSNEKGFLVTRRNYNGSEVPLIDLPSRIPLGRLEYNKHATTLHTDDAVYSRRFYDGHLVAKRGDDTFNVHSGSLQVLKGDSKTVYHQNGAVEIEIGNMQSGRNWRFEPDGSISMRSQPYGRDKINLDADGKGFYVEKHGSMRIAGPRSNHTRIEESRTPATLLPDRTGLKVGDDVWMIPKPVPLAEGTNIQKAIDDFEKAKVAIEALYKGAVRY